QRRELFRGRQQQRLKAYFAMSPREKTAYLDEQINRMEQWRRQQAAAGPSGPRPARPPLSAEEREKRRKERLDLGTPGGRGRRGRAEERENRRKERLDWSTPEGGARRAAFFRDLQARRQQRGLGSSFPGGGRR